MRVSIQDLVVEYTSGGYAVRPLDGLSVDADAGELVLLLGASGCGKTTLLSVLAGILTPTAGDVVVDGIDVRRLDRAGMARYRQGTVGIVFQAFNLVPSLTALENVVVPMRLGGVGRAEAKRRAAQLLAQVGLEDRMHHQPSDLSGGQQQRVAIARSLAHDPPVLLADEPTAHLDYLQVEGVVRLLRDLADAGRTVIVATHDDRLLPLADRVVELTPRFQVDQVGRRHRVLEKGDVLFRQGEPSDLVYMVDRGRLRVVQELLDGDEELLATLGPGRFVGELGPLLGLQRSATVRAEVRTELTAYTATEFRSRVQGTPAAAQPKVPVNTAAAKKAAAKKAVAKKAVAKKAVAKKAVARSTATAAGRSRRSGAARR
jgi:putative ABC transport system ATP-binding protein